MNYLEIREKFFSFFGKYGHKKVASSSLIPADDPSLLFTNAGMNQFKDCFLGKEKRSYTRVVSIQKCVRAGGKHNDLDNVGFTDRHLTFFEMMGNFSFGDYFKEEAIRFAWEFLTQVLSIDQSRLYVTVFHDDQESRSLWKKITGLSDERITGLGADSNFWQMGDIGPCGPCSEIFYDRGPSFGCQDVSKCKTVACDCSRFLEIWNLVFMQFERQQDGVLKPLQSPGVDTGMGLERLSVVLEKTDSVFLTSLFIPLIQEIETLSGKEYAKQSPMVKAAFHVLADHLRSSALIIADGGIPSNEGRGYVLRKIIRRAVLFSLKLSEHMLFPTLLPALVKLFGPIYPELVAQQKNIQLILASETEKFAANVIRGSAILEEYFTESASTRQITGDQAFKLYDTYGFPLELVIAGAREQGYVVDIADFEKRMMIQQAQSGKKGFDELDLVHPEIDTIFTGYDELHTTSTIAAIVYNNQLVDRVQPGSHCYIIPVSSPFFIVGGGQVPDKGFVTIKGEKISFEEVRYIDNAIAILIKTPVVVLVGDEVTQQVDQEKRLYAMKNHTATHLLQAALIEKFGPTIKQSGSLVHPDYLRFDFTFHGSLSSEDVKEVEWIVNKKIQENIPVTITYTTLQEATGRGALAFFGDKYNEESVRVIGIDHFSTELCGGTHVKATGEIGFFKIIENVSPAAGQRRIHAVSGKKAVELAQHNFEVVKQLSQEFKVKREQVLEVCTKQKEEIKALRETIDACKQHIMLEKLKQLDDCIAKVDVIPVGVMSFDDFSVDDLRKAAHFFIQRKKGLYALYSKVAEKIPFVLIADDETKQKIDFSRLKSCLEEKTSLRGGITKEGIQGNIAPVGSVPDVVRDCIKRAIL
jgi:alanyl-tRNA synthetase